MNDFSTPEIPSIRTGRLLLRPFADADAPIVQKLAGDKRVAATTAAIPHPYEDGMAEEWIATHEAGWHLGRGLILAMTVPPDEMVIGAIGFTINPEHETAELGYWLGVSYWGQGFGTEAARAMIEFGFSTLALHRVQAHHLGNNPASGRIMQKVGMKFEGRSPGAFKKWGEFLDVDRYGILHSQWNRPPGADGAG